MTTSGITGTTGVATPYASLQMGTGTAVDKTSLNGEAMLNLLVTQMRYQDPSQPMDSSQIMQQTSQLASVEKLTELSTTQREAFALQMRLSAANFIGQTVSWSEGAVTRSGRVEGASFAGSTPVLTVGDKTVALDAVSLVGAAAAAASTTAAATQTTGAAQTGTATGGGTATGSSGSSAT